LQSHGLHATLKRNSGEGTGQMQTDENGKAVEFRAQLLGKCSYSYAYKSYALDERMS
jgi:hypothetical protein